MNYLEWFYAVVGTSAFLASATYCATAIYRTAYQNKRQRQIMQRFDAI